MAYRHDKDLEFLSKMNSKDLDDLVYCLTHDKDGKTRYTEELTNNDMYKRHFPNHTAYWREIAAEIQCYGGNTFATMFRGGKGVLYKEVLEDVCDKLKVNYSSHSSVDVIESNLLMKILTDAIERMTPEELKELALATGIKNIKVITKETLVAAFQAIFRAGGFKSYQLTVIIVNAVLKALIGRGLTFAGNATLTRAMAVLTGPIGWVITGVWTAIDIASPAYRVTIPATICVAVLRQQHLYSRTLNGEQTQVATLNLKIIELEKALEEAIKRFKGDKEYFNYILGATALGIAMANADGEIVSEERQEIEEFIGGIANSNYPEYIRHLIEKLYETKPSFNEAMIYVEKIDPSNYESLRNLLEVVALADGIKHETEVAFLRAFDSSITKVKYVPELEDNQKEFLLARLTE